MRSEREYVNEPQLSFEITAVNLKEKYIKEPSEEIVLKFNDRLKRRVQEVEKELIETKKGDSYRDFLTEELEHLKSLTIERQNKERLGVMTLLIIKNLAKKPCFAGYSNNWKDEFYSKAVENVFKYIHNFDENKISKRTGAKVNAFSYVTQVVYTAFILTINERKREEERKSQFVSLENNTLDLDSKSNKRSSTFDFQYTLGIQKNIKEEFNKIIEKIKELEEIEKERVYLDSEIYCIKNNSKNSLMDPVFNQEFQKMVSKLNDLVFRSLELKKYLNIDYIPKEIHLFVLKGVEEKFRSDLTNLCSSLDKTFVIREVTKEEYNKLRGIDKKIPQKIVEDW